MTLQDTTSELRENPVFIELASLLGHGFILSLFTIDFLCFEYALPILGAGIMFYGCHLIRSHSASFQKAYIISFLRLLLMLINFLLDWTSLYEIQLIVHIQFLCSIGLVTGLFFYLNQGYRMLYNEAGLPSYRNRLRNYILLYWGTVAVTFLTKQLGILGALLSIPLLLINIIYVILSFQQTGKQLAATGLLIELDYMRKDKQQKLFLLLATYLLLLTVTIFLSNKGAFFETSSIVIDTQIAITDTEIEDKLRRLGMPENVIQDIALDKTELKEFQTAQTIYQNQDSYSINGGELSLSIFNIKRVEDYRLLIYYQWTKPPGNRLYHILECQSDDFSKVKNLNSKCLYDDLQGKRTRTFEIPALHTNFNAADHPYTHQKLSNEGHNLRGYFALSYTPSTSTANALNLVVNYYYQVSIFNLPYINILDYMNRYTELSSSYVYNRLSIPFTQLKP